MRYYAIIIFIRKRLTHFVIIYPVKGKIQNIHHNVSFDIFVLKHYVTNKGISMIKNIVVAAILSGMSLSSAIAETNSCQEQRDEINTKLEAAHKNGNTAEQNSLKIALDKVNTYCSEERQSNRATQDLSKKERKVKKEELDLEEAKADLEEAKLNGENKKIAKKERKLKEKELDLEEAKAELQQAKDDYNRLVK